MLTKVDLDPTQRSGLLTQAGFLSSYLGVGNEPDIIHRGVFIATRLLCKTLPPPDPKAAGTMIPNTPNLTNRQRVEMTTGKGTCGEACHNNLFNPLGFAFENYDAIGKYRTMDVGQTVDAGRQLRVRRPAAELLERRRALAAVGGRQGDTRLLRAEHDELPARSRARRPTSKRSSITTRGCPAPGWSRCMISSSPS